MEGARQSVAAAQRIAEFADEELEARYVTLFSFPQASRERWGRENGLMQNVSERLETFCHEVQGRSMRVRAFGVLEGIPASWRQRIATLVTETRGNDGLQLTLAINAKGRREILEAARRIAEDRVRGRMNGSAIDEELFGKYLATADLPDADLVILTGGSRAIPNFMLWQAAYAEYWGTETPWPEFTPEEMRCAIRHFHSRNRRFGGVQSR